MLLDKTLRCESLADTESSSASDTYIPSMEEIKSKVAAFKETLRVTPDKIREIERSTTEQSKSALWYSVRRYRLTASVFGRVLHMLPSTPPDAFVKSLLSPKHFRSPALDWGIDNEGIALSQYSDYWETRI